MKMQQKWCLRGNESGKDDRQPRKGQLTETCKMNGRGGKKVKVRVVEQRGGASSSLSSVFLEILKLRHQLDLLFDTALGVWTSSLLC